jgi:nucleoside-triphosphatase THEP1
MKIFITGQPGVGKSTLLQKILDYKKEAVIKGCIVDEIKEEKTRTGFKIRYISPHRETILASKKEHLSDSYIEQYSVNINGIEKELIPYMNEMINTQNVDYIIFDEIGRMQNTSPLFLQKLDKLLEKDTVILSSIVLENEEWAQKYKKADSHFNITITLENRDLCFDIIKYLIDHNECFKKSDDVKKLEYIRSFKKCFETRNYNLIYTLFFDEITIAS